ncbi:MAG: Mrp/NBP35 family ATP-binding protein [Gammaproteobacteria bacterium]|nr:Mrp/NBP35 family ATP-binding protein [Gammaproteobacteria bacterium]
MNSETINKLKLPGVRHIIAVGSGKGGVGKSTVSSNLALALQAAGHTVGLLDADIYGPSQGLMMGVASGTKPEVTENAIMPVMANGVQCMSMSFVASDRTPAVWRGPMASGALQQLISQPYWQNVDYLIVDMPPGTGDIQLTLSQNTALAGAVIVTTPQDIALLDARKAIEMFLKVEVPILGVVENMSTHVCSQCGHEEAIFGEGGGLSISEEYQIDLLGKLPLSLSVRQQSDGGKPTVISDPDGSAAKSFRDIAAKVDEKMSVLTNSAGNQGPKIQILDD